MYKWKPSGLSFCVTVTFLYGVSKNMTLQQGVGSKKAGAGPAVVQEMLGLVHSIWETITLFIQCAPVSCPTNHEGKSLEERGSY